MARDVTADDFRTSHFRGFVIGSLKYGVRSEQDIDALAQTGANLARIFVTLDRCTICPSYTLPPGDLETLDKLIDRLAAHSIKAVLVVAPASDSRGAIWNSSSLQQSLIEHWKTLASRYRGNPTVAGFDLINEPVPPGRLADYSDRQSAWLKYAEDIGRAIRSVDPNRVLIVESAPDATPTSYRHMKVLPLQNVVYSFHSYLPISFTHQGVMNDFHRPMTYGSGESDVDMNELHRLLKPVEEFASSHNVPILVGEFSCVRSAPSGSALRYVGDSIDIFESQGWSWIYHEFRGWPGWDAEIASGGASETKRSSDAPMIKLLRSRMSMNQK